MRYRLLLGWVIMPITSQGLCELRTATPILTPTAVGTACARSKGLLPPPSPSPPAPAHL